MATTIKCKKCGNEIEITEALKKELEDSIVKKFETQHQSEIDKLKKQNEIEKEQLKEKIENEVRQRTIEKVRKEYEIKIYETKEESAATEKQNKELTKQITDSLQQLREVKNKNSQLEVQYQKKLLEEQDKIKQEAKREAEGEYSLKVSERDKKIKDLIRQLDDAKHRAEQGPQQLQGEVLELELEDLLKREFPQDEIVPVPKGVIGADIVQKVYDRSGRLCGQIAWESKRTKTWSDGWVQKLKDDQRTIKADLGVIISTVLPVNVKGFALRDGVFVCDIKLALNLASFLRYDLIRVAESNRALVGKNEKTEMVYAYINSTEFKQRIQAIADAFINMKTDLEKEKRAYQSIWAKREKQINRVLNNTFGIYGDLKGLTGGSLQEIKMLELPEGEISSEK